MKKLAILLCVVLCAAMMLPLSVSAASWRIDENPVINIPKGTPTIDGNITADEGWSNSGWLNEMSAIGAWSTNPLTGTIEFNFAYTDAGLYFAANVVEVGSAYMVRYYDADGNTAYDAVFVDPNAGSYTCTEGGYPSHTTDGDSIDYYLIDPHTTSAPAGVVPKNCFTYTWTGNSFVLASGEDDIDNAFSWNGDVIGLSLDLLGAWEADGFLSNTDYVPRYDIALFEDGSVKVASEINGDSRDITVDCQAKGVQTANGATFEVMIPWETIVADQNDLGAVMGLSTEFTVEDVTAEGATHRGAVIWQDRFFDEEAGAADTWSRFITVCSTTAAGVPGFNNAVASMGLKLQMGGEGSTPVVTDPVVTDPVDTDPANTNPADSNTDKPADSTKPGETTKKDDVTTKKPTGTTKPASTKKPTTTTNKDTATQTFDAGIAVALGALATSALGVVYSKKRK